MDTSIEGNRGKPFRVVVEEGKVREFARAVKSSNPAYVAEGQPQATSPVTFLASSAFWQGPENSPASRNSSFPARRRGPAPSSRPRPASTGSTRRKASGAAR